MSHSDKISTYVFALLLLSCAAMADEVYVGNMKKLQGAVSILRNGKEFTAQLNDKLFQIDEIRTGFQSSAGIIFEDNTIISMGADSRLRLESFRFSPVKKDFSFVCRMMKGTFIYLSGMIGKIAPESIRIETPDGTAAVRGTKFAVQIVDTLSATNSGETKKDVNLGIGRLFEIIPLSSKRYNLFFLLDSIELTDESQNKIKEIIEKMGKQSSADIHITGHADRSGTATYNLKLSGKRAERIRDIFVAGGILPENIRIASHGEKTPLVSTEDGVPEQKNRRVEVVVSRTKRTIIILLEGQDGHVGEVLVSNNHGHIVLNTKDFGTMVTQDRPPSSPVVVKQENVDRNFKDALNALPDLQRYTLYFHLNLENLTADSQSRLNEIIDVITRRKFVDIYISGHTDRSGPDTYNAVLSRKRAERVKEMFVSAGITSDHIHSTYHGEGNPLIKTEDGVTEPLNRRVEVVVK